MARRSLMLTLTRLTKTLFSRRKSLSLKTKQSRCRDSWRSCESSLRASGLPVTWGTQNAQSADIARSKRR
jgi:hypothetical protein